MAENRFAVAVEAKPEGPATQPATDTEREAVAVYVVDPPAGPPGDRRPAGRRPSTRPAQSPKMTRAARITVPETRERGVPLDLAFSPDGRKLVAAIVHDLTAAAPPTWFYELDPAGRRPPKLLFKDAMAYGPQWAPDGRGIVYMRGCEEDEKFREVVLWRPPPAGGVLLARFPGKYETGCTDFRWLADGRLRIYSVGDGIRIIETKADGSGAAARLLPAEHLVVQKHLADLTHALKRIPPVPGKLPDALAERLTRLHVPLEKAIQQGADALGAAWDAVDDWKPTAAVQGVNQPTTRP
jgi:hypothetical protein